MNKTIDHVVCAGGKMLSRVNIKGQFGSITALIPFVETADLPTATPKLELEFPKVPWDAEVGGVIQAYNYFSAVWDKQASEAFVWWHWDQEEGRYYMVVPSFGHASSGGVTYDHSRFFCKRCRVALADGIEHCPHCKDDESISPLVIFGTSHSHGEMAAFHSPVDDANELSVTGFHITFGELSKGPAGLANSFVMSDSKHRFKTTWTDHFQMATDDLTSWRMALWLSLIAPSSLAAASKDCVVKDTRDRIIFAGSEAACNNWVAAVSSYTAYTFRVEKQEKPVIKTWGRDFSGTRSLYYNSAELGSIVDDEFDEMFPHVRHRPDQGAGVRDLRQSSGKVPWPPIAPAAKAPASAAPPGPRTAKKSKKDRRKTRNDVVTREAWDETGFFVYIKRIPLGHVPAATVVMLDTIYRRQLDITDRLTLLEDVQFNTEEGLLTSAERDIYPLLTIGRIIDDVEKAILSSDLITVSDYYLRKDSADLATLIIERSGDYLHERRMFDRTSCAHYKRVLRDMILNLLKDADDVSSKID